MAQPRVINTKDQKLALEQIKANITDIFMLLNKLNTGTSNKVTSITVSGGSGSNIGNGTAGVIVKWDATGRALKDALNDGQGFLYNDGNGNLIWCAPATSNFIRLPELDESQYPTAIAGAIQLFAGADHKPRVMFADGNIEQIVTTD